MEGWEKKKLGDVLSLEYGKPLPKERRSPDGKFPAYGANGIKCRTDEVFCTKASIIVGRKGSAGEINLAPAGFWPLDVTYFVTFEESQHNLKFLYHLLSSLNLTSLAKGVKPGINRNDVYQINSMFPPLPEQERIVAILDEAFAAIATATANAEKNLANARELFESGLEQLTYSGSQNNCLGNLGDCCTIKTGKKDVNEGNPEGEYPFFTCAKEHTYSDVYSFDTEAILVAGNGAVGQTSYYNGKFEAYQRTYVLCDFQDIHVMYLRHLLQAKLAKAVSKTKLGNTMPYIKKGMLTNFEFPLPPIQTQGTIAAKLDVLEQHCQDLESEVQQKLDHLTNLKQSLLHKAFTGELTADKKATNHTLSKASV